MDLRPADRSDIERLAHLIVGDPAQASTVAAMSLFALESADDAIELNRVMIASTEGWKAMTVAGSDVPAGLVQLGEGFLQMTPEIVEFAVRTYGEGFEEFIGPRLEALSRVHGEYPAGCLRISEIHVWPDHRGRGVGTALMNHAVDVARREKAPLLALQTLTNNPARQAFEAWGFSVAETKTDAAFEALTGAAGYHLMLRRL